MQSSGLITLEMIQRNDVLKIGELERFAGAIYHSTSSRYDWVDVVLEGGPGEEALEFALLDGVDRWYVVYFTEKLIPESIGLRRGNHLPDSLIHDGDEYTLQTDGQNATDRVDRKEQKLTSHYADYICGKKHIGITIYDVDEAVYAGEAEAWYGEEIDFNSIELLPIDTEHPRKGLLTNSVYKSLPSDTSRHWWSKGL